MSNENIGATGGVAWTPSNTVLIDRPTRGFQVGVAGDVALEYADGSIAVWPACTAGSVHAHWSFIRLRATGTTATGIMVAY